MRKSERTPDSIAEQVDHIILEMLNEEQRADYNRSFQFVHFHLDAGQLSELCTRLNKEFSLQLSPTAILECASSEALIKYVTENTIQRYRDWYYDIQWWPRPLVDIPPSKSEGVWLVLSHGGDFSSALCRQLHKNNQRFIIAKPSDQFKKLNDETYEVNFSSHKDFCGLLEQIANMPLLGVAYFLENTQLENEMTYSHIESTLEEYASGLMAISKALCKIELIKEFKMWVIDNSVITDGNFASLIHAPLSALCKVLWEEHPEYKCTHLSVDPTKSPEDSCTVICDELRAAVNEPEIVWKGENRFVARLVPVQIESVICPQFDESGTYVIAGGLRPLGLEVVHWYINHGAKNIILLDEIVVTNELQIEIDQLKKQGIHIAQFVVSFDNFLEFEAIFNRITAEFPPVRGVIHAAGIIEQDLLMHLSWERFQESNRLKIAGSWHLHMLTKKMNLDHFILFGTALLELAPYSRGAYLLANAFLDALSHFRRGQNLPSLTIDWGPWSTRKITVQHITDSRLTSRVKLLDPAKGIDLLESLFYMDTPQVMAVEVHWETLLAQLTVKNPLFDEILRTITPSKSTTFSEPIAIVGMGCRFPGGANSPEKFWELLKNERSGVIEIPKERWDLDLYYDADKEAPGKMYIRKAGFLDVPVDAFDADFFGISRREAEEMDPQQRLLLEVCYEALEYAGIAPDKIAGGDAGVFIGVMFDDYLRNLDQSTVNSQISPYYASGNLFSVVSGRISYFLGARGPCLTVDTACSSSLVAIDIACERLLNGETSIAIAGGVNLTLRPESVIMECKAKMLAEDGRCKTFDASADGFGRGEGCGVVVLKRLSDARRDGDTILALIKSSVVSHGGTTNGLTVPSGLGQTKLIRAALKKGGIAPDEISYIEAHGTGTTLGDAIEVEALGTVFKRENNQNPLVLGSVKTNLGHTESAAGVAGIIKVVLSLLNKEIPAHVNFSQVNPLLNLSSIPAVVNTKTIPWECRNKPRIAGVSSFGFSGINAHIILEEAIHNDIKSPCKGPFLFVLSAKSEAAVKEQIHQLKHFLETHPDIDMSAVAYTLQVGRQAFMWRSAIVCATQEDGIAQLASLNRIECCKTKKILKNTDIPKDLKEVAELWLQGAKINWNSYYVNQQPKRIALPTYPFQRQKYWSEAIAKGRAGITGEKSVLDIEHDHLELFDGLSHEEQKAKVRTVIRNALEKITKVTPHDDESFYQQGIDSLMIAELKNKIDLAFRGLIELDIALIMDNPSVDQLTEALLNVVHLKKRSGEWIIEQKANKKCNARVFCFHHAGGGASAFSSWRNMLPEDVSLCLIQLPGRENRRHEPFVRDLESVITEICTSLESYLDVPAVFFGHSMGAYICYQVANRLKKSHHNQPKHLIISCFSPIESDYSKKLFAKYKTSLSDTEFIDYIENEFGGIPEKIRENKELLDLFLPVLRADFSLFTANLAGDEKTDIPITTIFCSEDHANTKESITEWSTFTTGHYKNITTSGGHFELLHHPAPFIAEISSVLKTLQNM